MLVLISKFVTLSDKQLLLIIVFSFFMKQYLLMSLGALSSCYGEGMDVVSSTFKGIVSLICWPWKLLKNLCTNIYFSWSWNYLWIIWIILVLTLTYLLRTPLKIAEYFDWSKLNSMPTANMYATISFRKLLFHCKFPVTEV